MKGGAECVTLSELKSRVEAEKQQKLLEAQQRKQEVELSKKLKQQVIVEKKEDREVTEWLKKEQPKQLQQAATQLNKTNSAGATTAQTFPIITTIIPGKNPDSGQISLSPPAVRPTPAEPVIAKPAIAGVPITIGTPVAIGSASKSGVQIEALSIPIAGTVKSSSTGSPWTVVQQNRETATNNNYTFKNIAASSVQVSNQGKPVAITTPELATLQYGYTATGGKASIANNLGSVAAVNNALLESGPGKIVTDVLDKAGKPFAVQQLGGWTQWLGYGATGAAVASAWKRGDKLLASELLVNSATVKVGESLGAAAFPQNPVLGKAVGGATTQAVLDAGDLYVAPWLGTVMYNSNPSFFTPK